MSCRDVRRRLTAARDARREAAIVRHLEACDGCTAFARRLDAARRAMREHHADVEPDPAFAERVVNRLPQEPVVLLGQVAVRLIPATAVLLLVLTWLAFGTPGEVVSVEAPAPTDDVVSWIAEQAGTDR